MQMARVTRMLILAALMWLPNAAGTAWAAQQPPTKHAPQQALKTTLADLASSKAKAARLEKQLQQTTSEMASLRKNATALAADVQSAEAQADAQEKRHQKVASELAAKQKEYDIRQSEYAQTLSTMLRMRDVPSAALMADSAQTQTMLRTARIMQEVNTSLAEKAAALKEEMVTLEALKADAQASKIKFERAQEALAKKQASLKKDLIARQALQAQLTSDHEAAAARVRALSKNSRTLQDLIQKLAAQTPRIAKATQHTPLAATPQGRWHMPVVGRVLHRFGDRKNANETYRGLVLQGRAGGTVVAPASGEVVFTGPFRDYGPMVLLKHGKGSISLLAGLGEISVSLNQMVGRGEPVGRMRNSGAPELYVELRNASKPIDPTRWFGKVK